MGTTVSYDEVKRIGKELKKEGRTIRTNKGGPYKDRSEYFIIELSSISVLKEFNNLEEYARENGYLKDGEELSI